MAEFCKASRAKASCDHVPDAARALIPYIRALLIVAHSNALSRHFEILTESRDLLPLPSVNLQAKYVKFATKHGILPPSTSRSQEVAPGRVKPKVEGTVEDPSVSINQAPFGGDSDELGDEVGEESFEMARSATTSHTGEMFRRWFKSFVNHFSAKRALEIHSSKTIKSGGHIRIHVLGTDCPTLDPGSWGEVTDLINVLVEEIPVEDPNKPKLKAEMIIASIKSHLSEYDRSAHPESYHKVYKQFQCLLDKEDPRICNNEEIHLFPGCQHCEAILAAASLYHRAMAPENQDLAL
jgi:hypothetical protein